MSSDEIISTAKEMCYICILTAAITFAVCFICYGIHDIIMSPSKDEEMADKGYVMVPVEIRTSRSTNYIWVPSNSTEYKLYLSKLLSEEK